MPNRDRLSALAATVLLAYALAQFVSLPERRLDLEFLADTRFGVYLALRFNAQTLVSLLVAGLTAAGADWLLRDHPALGSRVTLEHLLLPALTALVIQLPLAQLPFSPWWWLGFALGGALIILVLLAEYIVVDPDDERYAPAAAGLTVLSFSLYLVLAATLHFANSRLLVLLPVLALAAGLVSLRALHLRLHGHWAYLEAGLVALLVGQLAAALHYWPVSPVAFGLALLGPAYALTSLFGNLIEGETFPQVLVEPGVVLALVWAAAVWLG